MSFATINLHSNNELPRLSADLLTTCAELVLELDDARVTLFCASKDYLALRRAASAFTAALAESISQQAAE